VTTTPPASRREIVRQLARAQKSNRGAAGYSRWVNRRLGRQLAALAYLGGLTPNQVSAISALFTFPAIAALAVFRPTTLLAVIATLALLLGYAFDSADGQVARLRGGGSPSGEWLDHVLDSLKVSSFHIAVAIMWFRFYGLSHAALLLIPLAFTVVSAVFFFALILTDMLRRIERANAGASSVSTASVDPDERAPVLRSLMVLPNDYGVLCLALLLVPVHALFVVVYSALLAANLLFLLAGCLRWFREMTALRAAPTAAPIAGPHQPTSSGPRIGARRSE
jgi:phosphatidylglycerophosphate synthase